MKKTFFPVLVALFAAFIISGCVTPETNAPLPENQNLADTNAPLAPGPDNNNNTNPSPETGLGSNEETGMQLSDWNASDNSITLKTPAGWTATEKQVDNCTVNWSVSDSTATKTAYMNNQILVFKSEDAREIYRTYGMQGVDQFPVSGYLVPEEAVSKIVAPLGGSSNVQITEMDTELSGQFSQAVCISGLAGCNALVFDATYENNGNSMKGKYFVQTIDLGDGYTWWINIWGYTSKASEWEESKELLETIFTSVQYTSDWSAKCQQNTNTTSSVIQEVIKKRQESMDNTVQQWNNS